VQKAQQQGGVCFVAMFLSHARMSKNENQAKRGMLHFNEPSRQMVYTYQDNFKYAFHFM
jgi:hypothetical protein